MKTTSLRAVAAAVLAGALLAVPSPSSGDRRDDDERDRRGTDIVVKLDPASGYTAQDVERDFPVVLHDDVLASRQVYLYRPTDPAAWDDDDDEKDAAELAKDIEKHDGVVFAEPDVRTVLADGHYHSWPQGTPRKIGKKSRAFLRQPLAKQFKLKRVHRISTGQGVRVAVLDTGVARSHPVLRGHLRDGYDYVDDDSRPVDRARGLDGNQNGVVDEAYGHGTFVAGMVLLVAPDVTIVPMRVLDSDGAGSIYLVAQAIWDATELGVDVVNLSLGTSGRVESDLVDEAIEHAHAHGVEVVAAAGNSAQDRKAYPAELDKVLSVTSVSVGKDSVSKFANWGDWVDVAAPGSRVRGPVPSRGFARWAGTSMAAPQVSGQVALLRAAGADREDGEKAVQETAREFAKDERKRIKHGTVDLLSSLRYLASR
ncbi:hypothetical protein NOK12_28120 [Nocardioides sp. OK12]|uniref:S8 family peptidase n=1 Tax=Nocardioides sp. OK12 TaxID=2758661 RepID=UPI0021C4C8CE|nr:S8 family serine peptidase [Nocardioides sp. OK12]GHJ60294.1 hypothetical protein NOK12_28120 [Nocardioides sp. OK12]